MSGQLQLSLLGKPQILLDGVSVLERLPQKGQALLFYLAATRQHHSRPALAGLFWGDMPEEVARTNLRLTLSKIRRVLPDYLAADRRTVGFAPGAPLEVDVWQFTAVTHPLHQYEREAVKTAVSLYRGDFLADVFIPNVPEFEMWLLVERENWRQRALDALYYLAETAVSAADLDGGIAAARRLLVLEPWHEEGHRQLMKLLAAAGQRSAALAQYDLCRRLLADELGIEPAPETVRLYEAIKNDEIDRLTITKEPRTEPPEPPHPKHNLPPVLTPFVGRESSLARLEERLRQADYRLITVVGEGGVGKTRLGLAAAARLLPHFPDGVWFVPLAGLLEDEPSVPTSANMTGREDRITTAVAAALELTFATAQEPKEQLFRYLHAKSCLLFLDNFEVAINEGGLLLELLQAAPAVKLLVTSREPLHFQAEFIFRLAGMSVPESAAVTDIAGYDSVRLFAERAERGGSRDFLAEAALPDVVQICRLVEGLPLGIELAASWTRWLSLPQILAAMHSSLDALASAVRDVAGRHRSLRAVFDYSWQLLSPEEQSALAQMSLFRGRFTYEAVQAVLDIPLSLLFALIDKSLLQRRSHDFYGLHNLLRQFAAEKLALLLPDRTALNGRHAAYYLAFMAEQEPQLVGRNPGAALRQVQGNMENVLQAWQWAAAHGRDAELNLGLGGLVNYWEYLGLYREGEQLLAALIEMLPAEEKGRQTLLARLYIERANLLNELGRLDEALTAVQTGITLAEEIGERIVVANGRLRLAHTLWRKGQFADAGAELQEALALLQPGEATDVRAIILRGLATVAWRFGDFEQSKTLCQQALDLFRQIGDVRGENRANQILGFIALNTHDYETAESIFTAMRNMAQETGDRLLVMAGYASLGHIASSRGNFEDALALLEKEQALAAELGVAAQMGTNLSNLGDLKLKLGDFAGAQHCYEQAAQIFRELGAQSLESNVLAFSGLLAFQRGEYEAGERVCRQALALAEAAAVQREQAFAHLFLAHNLYGLQEITAAQAAYAAAVTAWEALGDNSRTLEARAGLAQTALEQGDVGQALNEVESILVYLENGRLEGADDPVRVYLVCWKVLTAVQDKRAPHLLHQGRRRLQAQTAKITDPHLRQGLLENIPSHRTIRAL